MKHHVHLVFGCDSQLSTTCETCKWMGYMCAPFKKQVKYFVFVWQCHRWYDKRDQFFKRRRYQRVYYIFIYMCLCLASVVYVNYFLFVFSYLFHYGLLFFHSLLCTVCMYVIFCWSCCSWYSFTVCHDLHSKLLSKCVNCSVY